MRVLVYEQWERGHYYSYVRYLLPQLIELADEVILALTEKGSKSEEFRIYLEPVVGRCKLDLGVPYEVDWSF